MPDLAVVAVSYKEVRVNIIGLRVEDAGFFTGIAEYRNGRWQLRDAHWSVAAPPRGRASAGLKIKSRVTGSCFATRLEGISDLAHPELMLVGAHHNVNSVQDISCDS